MYHYVYKLELPETKEYYFGSRTSKVEPIKDVYYLPDYMDFNIDKIIPFTIQDLFELTAFYIQDTKLSEPY